MDKQNLTFSFS